MNPMPVKKAKLKAIKPGDVKEAERRARLALAMNGNHGGKGSMFTDGTTGPGSKLYQVG